MILAGVIAAAFLFFERLPSPEKKPLDVKVSPEKQSPAATSRRPQPLEAPKTAAPMQAKEKQQRVAIVIDDIGFDMKAVRELADIPAPIAFSILPYSPHCADASTYLHERKKDILLHLPMEPHGYPQTSPGRGALHVSMDEEGIVGQLAEDLALVPYASGANNHMGSRFMEDAVRLEMVMAELKKRGLFFIDSRTSPRTAGKEAALRTAIPFAERDIFIDHASGYQAARAALRKASSHRKNGDKPLLLIGHPRKETIRAIQDVLPEWEKEGITVVRIKECLSRTK